MITSNTPNGCNFNIENQTLFARFEPNEYTCNTGYYLPANATGCIGCLTGYTCTGGTYSFNEKSDQGINLNTPITTNVEQGCGASQTTSLFLARFEPNSHTCSAGYYLPANVDGCTICPANNICTGGTYTFNETTDQGIQSCANGTFAPTGSAVCYPHILHVGDSNVYLKSTKQTTPSLNIKIGNDIFYANMTTTQTKMNKDSTHYFRAKTADNTHYYICDDTTCPQ